MTEAEIAGPGADGTARSCPKKKGSRWYITPLRCDMKSHSGYMLSFSCRPDDGGF